jgi:hypothetical protein
MFHYHSPTEAAKNAQLRSREYLKGIGREADDAAKHNRHGHRDATMVAYRQASEQQSSSFSNGHRCFVARDNPYVARVTMRAGPVPARMSIVLRCCAFGQAI